MANRQELAISDCDKCKAMMTKEQRQSLGCGYEPKHERLPVVVWSPPSGRNAYSGPAPTICPGYTTSLPEVIEAAITRAHWLKGNVDATDDQREDLLNAILVLDAAYNGVQHWMMTPSKDGGGGS